MAKISKNFAHPARDEIVVKTLLLLKINKFLTVRTHWGEFLRVYLQKLPRGIYRVLFTESIVYNIYLQNPVSRRMTGFCR